MRWCHVLVLAALAAGCAVPGSVGGYLSNRRHDLIDVAHVDFGAINVGAVAYVGPFMAGFNYQTGLKTRQPSSTLQLGLGGPRILGRRGLAAGILWPASHWDEQRPLIGQRPKRAPSGLGAGAAAGALGGVAAEVDALELIDFVLGLFCLDLMEDDEIVVHEDTPEPDKAAEDAPPKAP